MNGVIPKSTKPEGTGKSNAALNRQVGKTGLPGKYGTTRRTTGSATSYSFRYPVRFANQSAVSFLNVAVSGLNSASEQFVWWVESQPIACSIIPVVHQQQS